MVTPSSYWADVARSELTAPEGSVPQVVPRRIAGRLLVRFAPRRVYSYAIEDAPKMRWLDRALEGTGPLTLDVGVRTGKVASYLRSRGKRCFGIDLAPEYIDFCRSAGLIEGGAVCDIESGDIPAPSRFDPALPDLYDLVFLGEIIEHLLDGAVVLQKLARLIRPRGHLIITTPNLAFLANRIRLLLGRDLVPLTIDRGEVGNQHIRVFTVRLLTRLCRDAGLRVDRVGGDGLPLDVSRYFDPPGQSVQLSIPAPARLSRGIYLRAQRA